MNVFQNSNEPPPTEAKDDLGNNIEEINCNHQNIHRTAINQNLGHGNHQTGDWACDKCGQISSYNKVRCMACNRWRDGRRPGIKSKASILASDLEQPTIATIAAVSASGKWVCHNCSSINIDQKSRCSGCQSWKGARRHNLPKRDSIIPTDDGLPNTPWSCDRCQHINTKGKSRCSSCQHWKSGKRLNIRSKNLNQGVTGPSRSNSAMAAVPPAYTTNTSWQCKCGRYNFSVRCKSCQSYKNCKGQLEFRRQMGTSVLTGYADTTSPWAISFPWTCYGCNQSNSANSERCDSCQRFRNPPYYPPYQQGPPMHHYHHNRFYHPNNPVNHHHQYMHGNPPMWPTFQAAPYEPQTDQAQQQPMPWMCPHCNRENLAEKVRCSTCQKWKG